MKLLRVIEYNEYENYHNKFKKLYMSGKRLTDFLEKIGAKNIDYKKEVYIDYNNKEIEKYYEGDVEIDKEFIEDHILAYLNSIERLLSDTFSI